MAENSRLSAAPVLVGTFQLTTEGIDEPMRALDEACRVLDRPFTSPDESFTTIELSINFFRPVWQTLLRAGAHVVNRGRNAGCIECDVTDRDGKRIAKARSTCAVLRGGPAQAR